MKPVTPTNFRKSNAIYLAKCGLNAARIEDRQQFQPVAAGRERVTGWILRELSFGHDNMVFV